MVGWEFRGMVFTYLGGWEDEITGVHASSSYHDSPVSNGAAAAKKLRP